VTAYPLTDKGRMAIKGATRVDVVSLSECQSLQAELDAADRRLAELESWILIGLMLEGASREEAEEILAMIGSDADASNAADVAAVERVTH